MTTTLTRQRSAKQVLGLATFVVFTSLLLGGVLPGAASALTRPFLGTFCESTGLGTAPCDPAFSEPAGLAVDQVSGDLHVVENEGGSFPNKGALKRFTATAEPDPFSALEGGSNVIDGHAGDDDATPQGEILTNELAPAREDQIAVAPAGSAAGTAGNIYVTDAFNERVDIFASDGTYLGQYSGAGYPCGVSVGPNGEVFVGDYFNGVHKLVPTAPGVLSEAAGSPYAAPEACNVAAGYGPTAGFVFVAQYAGPVLKIDSEGAEEGETKYTVDSGPSTTVAVDPGTGYVYVASGSEVREYDASGASAPSLLASTSIASEVTGIAIRETSGDEGGELYVTRSGSQQVEVWGALEAPAPLVKDPGVAKVGFEDATLEAAVNPEGSATSYHFEYVDKAHYDAEGGFASSFVQETPENPSGFSDNAFHNIEATIEGLEPGTTYLWRLVATNSAGTTNGPSSRFHTWSGAEPLTGCANDPLRVGVASFLPDCRAYEMASPPDKESAELAVPTPAGGDTGLQQTVRPIQASLSGGSLSFPSATAFGPDPESAPGISQYLSQRMSSGWSTENLDPRFEEGFLRDPVVGLSEDLSWSILIVLEPALTPDANTEFPNIYRRDNSSGDLLPLTTQEETPEIAVEKADYCLYYGGASSDFDHIFFGALGALNEGDPVGNGFNLYEWSPENGLQLISVLPNGAPANPSTGTSFGIGNGQVANGCNPSEALLRHAISSDGRRAVWTYSGGPYEGSSEPLFDRIVNSQGEQETIQLDASQGGTGSGGGQFRDASTDGRYVFFMDGQRLTAGASSSGADLYRYDVDAYEAGDPAPLENLTGQVGEPAGVQGVIAASADGSSVYFVAHGVLDDSPNGSGEEAEAGQKNVYLWQDGSIRYIATLDDEDGTAWVSNPSRQNARVTPDGRHLTFISSRSLTGYPTLGGTSSSCAIDLDGNLIPGAPCAEAFRYDAQTDDLLCISCNPSGARPLSPPGKEGETSFPAWSTPYVQARFISDDGSQVFFQSYDALSVRDSNEAQDVYQWEVPGSGTCTESSWQYSEFNGGCVSLLSTGSSPADNYFLDASADGGDVFLATRQQLTPQDHDERYDVYDARAGGGIPFQPPGPPCDTEGCRGSATSPGNLAVPGSSQFFGPGNQIHKRCPKGKRRVVRHGKTRCVRKHKRHTRKHQANSNRRAGK